MPPGEHAELSAEVARHSREIEELRQAAAVLNAHTTQIAVMTAGVEGINRHLTDQDAVSKRIETAIVGDNNGQRGIVRRIDAVESDVKAVTKDVRDLREEVKKSRGRMWSIVVAFLSAAASATLTALALKLIH